MLRGESPSVTCGGGRRSGGVLEGDGCVSWWGLHPTLVCAKVSSKQQDVWMMFSSQIGKPSLHLLSRYQETSRMGDHVPNKRRFLKTSMLLDSKYTIWRWIKLECGTTQYTNFENKDELNGPCTSSLSALWWSENWNEGEMLWKNTSPVILFENSGQVLVTTHNIASCSSLGSVQLSRRFEMAFGPVGAVAGGTNILSQF